MKDHKKNIDEIISLYKLEKFAEAHKEIDNLLLSDKDNPYLFNLKGIVYRAEKQYQNSLNNYNKAITISI